MTAVATALVRCRDVDVEYGPVRARVQALRGVTLEIDAGERIAVSGPSGCGKTTLLHVLGGLVAPTSGAVDWDGRPLSTLDASARGEVRRHGVAYVFQGANLLPYFTALENVAFAAHVSGEPSDAPRLLGLVGLADKALSLPADLSGGEAQRVAVARALAQQPRLLLCDEPTGHLDSETAAAVLDLLDDLQERRGFALCVATHDPDVVARFGRDVELADGRVVRDGADA